MKKYIIIIIILVFMLPLYKVRAEITEFPRYSFSSEDIFIRLVRKCYGEQGSPAGAAAEASLMANRYELYGPNDQSGDNLVNYVITSGWWGTSSAVSSVMSKANNSADFAQAADAVRKVLVDGKRVLPKYVDEHDCYNCCSAGVCIDYGQNNGTYINLSDHSQYKQHQTVLHNTAGAVYTFYVFPSETSDPFGYTKNEYRTLYGDFCYTFDGTASSGGLGSKNSGIGGKLGGLLVDEYPVLTLITSNKFTCRNVLFYKDENNNQVETGLKKILDFIFMIIKIAAPVLTIGLSVMDYIKAISMSESLNKVNVKVFKRVGIGLCVFLLPYILDLLFYIFGLYDLSTCSIK